MAVLVQQTRSILEWLICNIAVQNTTTTKVSIVFAFVELDGWCCMLREEWEEGLVSDRGVFQNSYFYTKLENKTFGLPSTRAFLLGNGNYCNVTHNMKISIFSVADGVLPLIQYRRKPYCEKNFTDEEIRFNYSLSSKRCVTENGFRIWINRFRIFACH